MKVFIDYPVSDTKEFRGLSFPQVLHDYLKTQDCVEIVGADENYDILFVICGGSHFKSAARKSALNKLKSKISSIFENREKVNHDRKFKPNIVYENRITNLIQKNSDAKIVHRLDDRYRFLCKNYGFDDTVSWINKRASATVFQTQYCKSLYTQGVKSIFGYEKPLDAKNGVIIYNGVDEEVFCDRGPEMDLKGEHKIFHVSTTGMSRKGLGTVLEFAQLLRKNPDFQFYLVGRQDEDPVFGYEIKKFENVHHFGHTNDRYELATYYRSGDILLYPTINDCSPNVVLEAMSCGMPVVAADSGGTPELIYKDDVHGGILIDERNPIFALKEVVNHLDLFKKRCVELVEKYHCKEVMGRNYLDLFKSLM
jgi:glycosyltransferase involved in cell wall biosynthesis